MKYSKTLLIPVITLLFSSQSAFAVGGLNDVSITGSQTENSSSGTIDATIHNDGDSNSAGEITQGAGQIVIQQGTGGGNKVKINSSTVTNNGEIDIDMENEGDADLAGNIQQGGGQIVVQSSGEIASSVDLDNIEVMNDGTIKAKITNDGDASAGTIQQAAGQIVIQQ